MTDLFAQESVLAETNDKAVSLVIPAINFLSSLDLPAKVAALNALRRELHKVSPFASEPVDCVQWVSAEEVGANDYNPNSVAPPEMKLLEHSITEDGYTQPIVAWKNCVSYEVVDVVVGESTPLAEKVGIFQPPWKWLSLSLPSIRVDEFPRVMFICLVVLINIVQRR